MRTPKLGLKTVFVICALISATATLNILSAHALSQTGASALQTPLFPEDGSTRVNVWTTTERTGWVVKDVDLYIEALKSEGVRLRALPKENRYLQDLGYLAVNGKWILNAPYEGVISNESHFSGLTMNVANEDWGPVYVTPEDVVKYGHAMDRQMEVTFAEGGATISGRRKDGTPYVIADDSVIARAMAYSGKPKDAAIAAVAKDFGVKEQDLILINAYSHLDLVMLAIPGGRVLLLDQNLNLELLNDAVAVATDTKEKETIKAHIAYYKVPVAKDPPFNSTAIDTHEVEMLKDMAAVIQGAGIEVISMPGFIRTGKKISKSSWTRDFAHINYFNGFLGLNPKNERFYFTNTSRTMPSLDLVFAQRLSKIIGTTPEHIHFDGRFSGSDGLDCAGLPSFEP